MRLQEIIDEIKGHPSAERIGMILSHTGIVRGSSRDGRRVRGLKVSVDYEKLEEIIEREKQAPGIIEIRVEIFDERSLAVGDEIMLLVVAGDIREHVVTVLERTLNAIKATVTTKSEDFA